ncbi:MAG: AAA family ATPase [Lachnospiraceae bacterium]|jgi:putative ATP-dependent endonuclease of OLD family|nr:AAA family ATPase [Lachnospiraceae bacterium]
MGERVMYLKSLRISNFRKFGTNNNVIEFVDAQGYEKYKCSEKFNIATTTTLIVGKNNVGKTTVIEVLDKLINRERAFKATDFNFIYLRELLSTYSLEVGELDKVKLPCMEFIVEIGLDKGNDDLITNIIPFMLLEDVEKGKLDIKIRYEVREAEELRKEIENLFAQQYPRDLLFNKFLELLDKTPYVVNYYNKNDQQVDFTLKDLIELRPIKANIIEGDRCLSKAFNKIVKYRYNVSLNQGEKTLEAEIIKINGKLSSSIKNKHTKPINETLKKIVSDDKMKVQLRADLSFQKFLDDLVRYEYVEKDISIPEDQFGLGYTNLMMIIAELMEYMERYPDDSFNSKINLISIEEPETFMHPQMQELFIKNINDAIIALLEIKHKNVNSQLIITTHSPHILNSKVHSGNTFNNINYMTVLSNYTNVINLNDEKIVPDSKNIEDDLKFLKKHIKYKVSELFFSDAVILVEGLTEYTLLPYYLEADEKLNKYYVSIFNINGAHALVYRKLLQELGIPVLIITDLDIKREKWEKGEDNKNKRNGFQQISHLDNRITTNETLKYFNHNKDSIQDLREYIEEDNIIVVYQGKISYYYATSFEEAYILTNYNNDILNATLKKLRRNIYKDIVGNKEYRNNRKNSYKWQCKLEKSKSDFANELLYRILTTEKEIPKLPKYIQNGFNILAKKLEERV